MNKDHMFGIMIAIVLIGFVAEFGFFIKQSKADIIIIQSPGGVTEGTIITFPPPPPPYTPPPPAPPAR